MRTPLHAILAATELVLADSDLPDRHRRHLRLVMVEALSLTELVNNFLDSARLSADRFEVVSAPFIPAGVMDEVAQVVTVSAEDKGLSLAVDVDPEVPRVVIGDAERIRRVMVNLATNAVKYTDAGHVVLTMAQLDDDWVRFEVADTGRGIAPETASRLFEPFEQATRDDQSQGFGLGLSLVRQIVDELGGRLDLESGAGGTTIWADFELPAGHLPALDRPTEPIGGEGRILVVDDGEVNRTLAESQLARLGYDPILAASAYEGLDLMLAERFDAVLMDWRMPGLNGLEAISQWRDHERVHKIDPPVSIVVVTANASAGDREKCLAAGASDFLAKPVSLADLDVCLRSVLRPKQPTRSRDFDRRRFDELVAEMGDEAAFALVATFVEHIKGQRRELEQAAWQGDVERVKRIAHTVRPNAELLGALGLAEVCERLEEGSTLGEMPVGRFAAVVDQALSALSPEGGALGPPQRSG